VQPGDGTPSRILRRHRRAVVGRGWLALILGCSRPAPSGSAQGTFDPGPVPAELAAGADLFLGACRGCHGVAGTGFSGGPPLLDTLYLRPAFPDSAIGAAIRGGVRRHHWTFDDMPPARTVRPDQIPALVAYIRSLQDRWIAARDTLPARGS
jgi:mono/diheme cytochrome c family protein